MITSSTSEDGREGEHDAAQLRRGENAREQSLRPRSGRSFAWLAAVTDKWASSLEE